MEELLTQKLEHLIQSRPHGVECMVAHEALAFEEGPTAFFLEILTNGCPCGLESMLNDRIRPNDFNNRAYHDSLNHRDVDTGTALMEFDSFAFLSPETFEWVAKKMYFRMVFDTESISDCFSPVAV